MLPWDALSDPIRRAIVERLAAGELGAGQLADAFPISRPAVSRHLRILREAGLVTSTVAGQERIYTLDRHPLVELDAWLDRFRPLPALGEVSEVGAAHDDGRTRPTGPAGRLDALDTEMARGRRERRRTARDEGDSRDRSTG